MLGRLAAEAAGVVTGAPSSEEPHEASVNRLPMASATAARRSAIERDEIIVVMVGRWNGAAMLATRPGAPKIDFCFAPQRERFVSVHVARCPPS
jgi:hypothetical protein